MLELNKLHLLDCMEGMKAFPDGYFSLAICDPPYGIKVGGSKSFGKVGGSNIVEPKLYKTFDDSKPPPAEYFNELMRVSENQIIFGGNYFINELYSTQCMLVWDKDNTGNFADCELAWTSFKSAVRLFRFRWNGLLQENMKNKETRIHPTQKPVQLYKWILHNYAKPDMKIIDTHVGSGSSIIAFLDFGCEWIGFELDPDYHKAATERIEIHKAQLKLF